jgi:hypothetical protein
MTPSDFLSWMTNLFFRNAALTALALPLSGCAEIIGLGRCDFEQRHVTAAGRFLENGTEMASAEITVGAHRGGLEWRDVQWYIKVPHEGSVTSIVLVRSGQPVPILLELPHDYTLVPYEYVSSLIQRKDEATPALGGLFEIVAGGEAVLEISTDVAARPHIRIPLAPLQVQDWYRRNTCS